MKLTEMLESLPREKRCVSWRGEGTAFEVANAPNDGTPPFVTLDNLRFELPPGLSRQEALVAVAREVLLFARDMFEVEPQL